MTVLADALPVHEHVEAVLHLHLPPEPRVVPQARAFVLEHAPPLSAQSRDVLELLTSELVTNAVIHARTVLEVGVTTGAWHVLVTVHDLDVGHQEVEPYGRDGGRGLGLVAALAERWDTTTHADGGKTAWFRVRRDG